MRWLTLLVLLFAAVTIYGEDEVEEIDAEPEAEEWEEDGILALTAENIDSFISENDMVLVEFYAPWCNHCKTFAPEYAKVAKELEETGSRIKVVKVDGSKDTKFSEEYDVKGYPTVKFFRSGSQFDYWGERQANKVIDWLIKKTGPIAVEIKNVEGAEEFIKSQSVAIVGFFKDRESDDAKAFLSTADTVDDYLFGITSNEDVYAKYGAKSGAIILFNNLDNEKSVFEGESSEAAILEFVAIKSSPAIIDFNGASTNIVFRFLKHHLLMFVSKEAGHMEQYVQPAKELAKQYRGKVLFIALDSDQADHQRVMSFFNVRKDDVPTMRLINSVDDVVNKYKPKEAGLSLENIKSFAQDGLDGKLKLDLLTQDLPEDWDKTPVKTIVATNFDEVAFNTDKHVFVHFYSPWSEECKQLAPIFDKLGEKYKDSETVVIAKMDSTANEFNPKHAKILLNPTLKLYTMVDNVVSYYNGKKTLDAFVKFIESAGEEVEFDDDDESVDDDEASIDDELLDDRDEL